MYKINIRLKNPLRAIIWFFLFDKPVFCNISLIMYQYFQAFQTGLVLYIPAMAFTQGKLKYFRSIYFNNNSSSPLCSIFTILIVQSTDNIAPSGE